MDNEKVQYRVLKINGLTKNVLLEIDPKNRLYKKYNVDLFDENISEHRYVQKYNNIDNPDEFIFITVDNEKEGK